MNILFRVLKSGSGSDVYFNRLFMYPKLFTGRIIYYNPIFEFVPELLFLEANPNSHIDIIHSNIEYAWVFKDKKIPLVVTIHHNVFDPLYQPNTSILQRLFYHLVLKRNIRKSLCAADRIIAVSKYTRDSIKKTFGNYQIDVIYNGIDTEKFRPLDLDQSDDKRFRLLFVGNLIKRKGADLLPQIMQKLGDDYVLYYTSGLRSKIPGNFKRNNMIPLGRLSENDLILEYNKCDAFLFPTRLEGFGYAVAEAMACDKPIIATNCSSIPELVEDEKNGFLCEINNVDDFVLKIKKLASDEQLRYKMGKANRNKIIEKFSIISQIKDYTEIYQTLKK